MTTQLLYTQNYIFKHFFSWYSKEIILFSFTSSERFNISVQDKNYVNKIIALGSFSDMALNA